MSGLRVTLEPFGADLGGTTFLTASGNLATTTMPTTSWSGAHAMPSVGTMMDTTSGGGDLDVTKSSQTIAASGSKSKEDHAPKDKDAKDAKYLENFLSSLSGLPDFVQEKVGRIKGIEKAIMQKSAALKDASAYHVQMIHLKLTKKSEDTQIGIGNTFSANATTGTGTSGGAFAMGNSLDSTNNFASPTGGNNMAPFYRASTGGGASSNSMHGGNGSHNNSISSSYTAANSFNTSSGSNTNPNSNSLPPLPTPSPLSAPLPYTLTPAVVQPLPTENLLNSLTYLLVGPVVHQGQLISPTAPPPTSGTQSTTGGVQLSRQEMGIMPMNISPASMPLVGKKAMTAQAQAAFAHPYASIPSPMELASTAVQPIAIDTPSSLTNESLDLRKRFSSVVEYDLDAAERLMREHHALLVEWQKRKSSLVTELFDQVDALLKRADGAIKKQESKLRRGAFEVPATPIDRRSRSINTPNTTNSAAATSTTASTASAGATTTPAAPLSASQLADSQRKRSYMTMIQEVESRELQYALQNELRLEIEKQSANAIATNTVANAASAQTTGSTATTTAEAPEPLYCTCKKVSFGAMVACDNDDCEIEWFHFSCVGLDTKPRGKWLCSDCRKKKKKGAAQEKDKEKEGKEGKEKEKEGKEKDKEKDVHKEKEKEKDEKEPHKDHSKEPKHEKEKHKKGDKRMHTQQ